MARHVHSVWALLFLSRESELAVRSVLLNALNIRPKFLRADLHLSVYYARRALDGLTDLEEPIDIEVGSSDLRFMAMVPGGENPRPNIDPALSNLGIRVKRSSPAIAKIHELRSRFYALETPPVLGIRRPSNHSRSAFGARHFQPHITLIRAGSGVDRDLTKIGNVFRDAISRIVFDRFVVRCRSPE